MAYNLLYPEVAINGVAMDSTITSRAVWTFSQDNIGVQLDWTGTPVGTFSIQISANHKEDTMGNIQVAGTWVTLTLSPSITASGSADSAYIDLNQLSTPWIRIIYTRSSGTGSLTATVVGKGV